MCAARRHGGGRNTIDRDINIDSDIHEVVPNKGEMAIAIAIATAIDHIPTSAQGCQPTLLGQYSYFQYFGIRVSIHTDSPQNLFYSIRIKAIPGSNPYRSIRYTTNLVAIRSPPTEERIDPITTCKYCNIPTEAHMDISI